MTYAACSGSIREALRHESHTFKALHIADPLISRMMFQLRSERMTLYRKLCSVRWVLSRKKKAIQLLNSNVSGKRLLGSSERASEVSSRDASSNSLLKFSLDLLSCSYWFPSQPISLIPLAHF